MKDAVKAIAIALGIVTGISLTVWWQVNRYHDCRNVGHARVYCVMTIGR